MLKSIYNILFLKAVSTYTSVIGIIFYKDLYKNQRAIIDTSMKHSLTGFNNKGFLSLYKCTYCRRKFSANCRTKFSFGKFSLYEAGNSAGSKTSFGVLKNVILKYNYYLRI